MKVEDVMSTKLITVSPDNAVRQAARLMMENRVSGLPVVDDGEGWSALSRKETSLGGPSWGSRQLPIRAINRFLRTTERSSTPRPTRGGWVT